MASHPLRPIPARAALIVSALLVASCGRSCGGTPEGGAEDAGAEAAAVAPPDLGGARACGNPAATPKQVVTEFLEASKARKVEAMVACFRPKHREKMAARPEVLLGITAISYTLGDERMDGDDAQVAATVERYDGRGGVEIKHDPIRLERVDGAWLVR